MLIESIVKGTVQFNAYQYPLVYDKTIQLNNSESIYLELFRHALLRADIDCSHTTYLSFNSIPNNP